MYAGTNPHLGQSSPLVGTATGSPRVARSPRDPTTSRTLPLVEPIRLTPRREPFEDSTWLFEPKYDGYRGLLYVTRQGCHFHSKRGNILKRFEQLCYWVREELPVKEAILDGEVKAGGSHSRAVRLSPRSKQMLDSLGTGP